MPVRRAPRIDDAFYKSRIPALSIINPVGFALLNAGLKLLLRSQKEMFNIIISKGSEPKPKKRHYIIRKTFNVRIF